MLSFSRDALLALFAHYNAAIWPAQIVAFGLGCLVLLLILKPRVGSDRFIAAVLAAGWIWTGVAYHLMYLAVLTLGAWAAGGLFVLQGGLLVWTGVVRGRLKFRFTPTLLGWIGASFAGIALLAAPLAGPLTNLGWSTAPVAGLASAPTALFTLGVLLLTHGRGSLHLLPIPVFWVLVAGAFAWMLRLPHDLIWPAA